VPIDFNQLREFVEAIAKTDITDLTIKEGDFELNMRKELPSSVAYSLPVSSSQPIIETKQTTVTAESSPLNKPAEDTTPKGKPEQWVEITSPMVGTFYRAPAPGEPAFVEVGDRISPGQVVCLIEAMKLMNEIEAEVAGEIVEIVVENGEPLEYGQTLMWVNPS
jgi:acetyl-CoA carboxylase biotin carboxyl carrier protein